MTPVMSHRITDGVEVVRFRDRQTKPSGWLRYVSEQNSVFCGSHEEPLSLDESAAALNEALLVIFL